MSHATIAADTETTPRAPWIYDLRTNRHFTLKANPLTRVDLDDFVDCYNAEARHERQETERFRRFIYDDLVKRDKVNLDILWLRDESMEDSADLPPPDEIAGEIVEDLRAALEQLEEMAVDLASNPRLTPQFIDQLRVVLRVQLPQTAHV